MFTTVHAGLVNTPAAPFPSLRKLSKDKSAKATPEETAKLFRRIQDDLAPWAESGITLQMVERSYCSTFHRSFRLQVWPIPFPLESAACKISSGLRPDSEPSPPPHLNWGSLCFLQTDLSATSKVVLLDHCLGVILACAAYTQGSNRKNCCSQIIKGEVFIVGETPGWTEFQRYIKLSILQAHRRYQLPDVDILISTDDGCPHLPDNIEGNCKTYVSQRALL